MLATDGQVGHAQEVGAHQEPISLHLDLRLPFRLPFSRTMTTNTNRLSYVTCRNVLSKVSSSIFILEGQNSHSCIEDRGTEIEN